MNQAQFEEQVNRSAAPHLKETGCLYEAIRLVQRERKGLNAGLVSETIMLAGQLHERYARETRSANGDSEADEEDGSVFSLACTPTDYLAGELLTEKLAPWAVALREDGFGHDNPPFKTVEAAASWIEQTSKADLASWREGTARRKRARVEIERLAEESGIEITFRSTSLPYQKPGEDHVRRVPTVPRTYLYRLALKTEHVAKRTGLAQDALVIHVLTGLRPAAPRMRIGELQHMLPLPDGEQVFTRWATVTFFARDLGYEEHRRAYNMVRAHVGGKGTEGIGYRDLTFWWLMQEMDAPPKTDKVKFWREALRRWKQLYPDVKPDRWEGVRKKYWDLRTRLERWGML